VSIEKAKGVIFGLAIGDALGYPTEFISLSTIKNDYGPSGITDFPKSPALFSDDTQMSIAIAEALIQSGNKSVEDIMTSVKAEFVKWLHSPENNRSPGNTCMNGIRNMERGGHWKESGIPESKGCGSAMRVAPIGFFYQNDPEKLKAVASASGICTHGHPTADAACIGAAYLVKLALDNVNPSEMITSLLSFTKGISEEFDKAILKVQECLNWEDEEKALDSLGKGWVGEEAVALALYCFLKYPKSYEKTVLRGANTNGDSDSIACIAGSISGAFLGISAISDKWINKIEKSPYLEDLSKRLSQKRSINNVR